MDRQTVKIRQIVKITNQQVDNKTVNSKKFINYMPPAFKITLRPGHILLQKDTLSTTPASCKELIPEDFLRWKTLRCISPKDDLIGTRWELTVKGNLKQQKSPLPLATVRDYIN